MKLSHRSVLASKCIANCISRDGPYKCYECSKLWSEPSMIILVLLV